MDFSWFLGMVHPLVPQFGFLNFCPTAAEAVTNPERWAYYTGAASPVCDFSMFPILFGIIIVIVWNNHCLCVNDLVG